MAARICKHRANSNENYAALSDIVRDCAAKEMEIYKKLRKVNL